MTRFSIVAAAALLAAAGSASAQPGQDDRSDRRSDWRGDLTRQQAIERADQRFARLDLDNDGRATPEEAHRAFDQRRGEQAGRMFERLDADRDGSISRAEYDEARQRRAERGPRRAFGGHRHRGAGMGRQLMFGEQGFVTREQMRERALARFDRLDLDRDGTLTAAERRQAREQRRQSRQERHSRPD